MQSRVQVRHVPALCASCIPRVFTSSKFGYQVAQRWRAIAGRKVNAGIDISPWSAVGHVAATFADRGDDSRPGQWTRWPHIAR